jgi:hypothetical protein
VKVISPEDQTKAVYRATWMLIDRPAMTSGGAAPQVLPASGNEDGDKVVRPWTDDYSNLIEILK